LFKNAIVRLPGKDFADGLTTAGLGRPDYDQALEQHAGYCRALRECGLTVTTLEPELGLPDSTFVEDTAVLTPRGAILGRPGAGSRQGEVEAIRQTITCFFPAPLEIDAPGTLDGGDICQAEDHFLLGLSQRTNQEGVRQLGAYLGGMGYTWQVVDVREMPGILHLKSAIAYIGDNTLVAREEIPGKDLCSYNGYRLLRVAAKEGYAANCVRVNDGVLMAAGYPYFTSALAARGFHPLILEMSEFQKMDGGLSCLSLRF
jgi:dimethylargininase